MHIGYWNLWLSCHVFDVCELQFENTMKKDTLWTRKVKLEESELTCWRGFQLFSSKQFQWSLTGLILD